MSQAELKEDSNIITMVDKNGISQQLFVALDKVKQARSIVDSFSHEYIGSLNLTDSFQQINSSLKNLNRKPIIGFFGHFDAGKSTVINTIINQELLPARYAPATCIVNLLMHIDDKPSSISGDVALFKKGFRPYMIHEQDLVDQYLIEQGDQTILERLGVHNYDEEDGESVSIDAYIAIVFSDADILSKIWLLDTPGDLNSSDDNDTEMALGGVEMADGIVFISSHAGFFKDADLGFAANIMRKRPPLKFDEQTDHLLFIQSHCHPAVDLEQIKSVGKITFIRIKKQLDKLVFNSWIEDGDIKIAPTPKQLTAKIQPFWRENNDFKTQTLSRIEDMAQYLIINQKKMVNKNIEATLSQLSQIFSNAILTLQERKNSTLKRMEAIKEQDARFREESRKLVDKFNALVLSCSAHKQDDVDSMANIFQRETSSEGLLKLINEIYDDKKQAQSEVGSYISQLLSTKLERVLKSSGKLISGQIDELLIQWQNITPSMQKEKIDIDIKDLDFDISGFNSRAAFIGGLAGLGSLGAMSLYVSTIASNLGAYILVGKAAGVLVSLGLVGSVTSVTSFVAAIGGPITIGIALAAMLGYMVYQIFGGSWQKSLAKKLEKSIRKKDVWDDVKHPIIIFWDSTEKAIKAGLKELILQTSEYIDALYKDARITYGINSLDKCILIINQAKETIINK